MFLPSRKEEEEQAVGAIYCKNIKDLLQQSDFVMLVVNLTSETHQLIGKRELGLMKPTATLINICRGKLHGCPNVSICFSNNALKNRKLACMHSSLSLDSCVKCA